MYITPSKKFTLECGLSSLYSWGQTFILDKKKAGPRVGPAMSC